MGIKDNFSFNCGDKVDNGPALNYRIINDKQSSPAWSSVKADRLLQTNKFVSEDAGNRSQNANDDSKTERKETIISDFSV